MFPANNLEKYFNQLNDRNWALIPVDKVIAGKLQNSAKTKFETNRFKSAGINGTEAQAPEIRNDSTFWLESKNPLQNEDDEGVLNSLQELSTSLKNFFRISLTEIECHYAVYQPGQYYKRHRDSLQSNNKRIFSFVIYLNENWAATDGGQLVGYENQNRVFSVLPEIGTMILFKSDLEHEVQPTDRTRYSLTGWFRR